MIHTTGAHDHFLMILSFLISTLAAYTVFAVRERIVLPCNRIRLTWLIGGAFVLGSGMWSMHFIAMLAFHLPVPISYHIPLVLVSMAIAIITSALTLGLIVRPAGRGRLAKGAFTLGAGMCLMHYAGMGAMILPARISYSLPLIALSVAVAAAGSYGALLLSERERVAPQSQRPLWRCLSALALGLAICTMHTLGMLAAKFHLPYMPTVSKGMPPSSFALAVILGIGSSLVIGFTLYVIFLDRTLQRLQHQHTLLLHSVADGIACMDTNGHTIVWNPAAERITGFSAQEVLGKPLHDLIHHTRIDGTPHLREECPLYQALTTGQAYASSEDIMWRKDGSFFYSEYSSTLIREDDQIIGLVVAFKDITERRETEELIRKTEKLKVAGQLAAGVAHEIRNPLTSLKGFLQLMRNSGTEKEEYYRIMEAELNRIEGIINELLFLSKPQDLARKETDLVQLLNHVIFLLEAQAILNNVQLEPQFSMSSIKISCDPDQIKQVFINLIKNGIEAMPNGGTLRIAACREGDDQVTIRVTDQGCGIPADIMEKLGQPFYTTKTKGTGLGLMVTYNIIHSHQGEISVESTPGKGTCFTVVLPVAVAEADVSPAPDPELTAKTPAAV